MQTKADRNKASRGLPPVLLWFLGCGAVVLVFGYFWHGEHSTGALYIYGIIILCVIGAVVHTKRRKNAGRPETEA